MMEIEFPGYEVPKPECKEVTELKIDLQEYTAHLTELSKYTKNALMDLLAEFTSVLPGPYRLIVDGKPTNYPGLYIPEKKVYAYLLDDAKHALAVFTHHPDNLRLYWSRVSPDICMLAELLLRKGPVKIDPLKEHGFGQCVRIVPPRYKYDSAHCEVTEHAIWFYSDHGYERGRQQNYLRLNRLYVRCVSYLPAFVHEYYSDQLPEGLQSRSAEAEALMSVPLVNALLNHGALKAQGARVTEQTAWKNKDAIPIPEILPDCGAKVTIVRTLFSISNLLPGKYWKGAPQDVLKQHYVLLSRMRGDCFFPVVLPYIKGFRAQAIYYESSSSVKQLLSLLQTSGSRWVLLEAIDLQTYVNDDFALSPNFLQSLGLEDSVMGRAVSLFDMVYVDQSVLRSFCAALFGLGMVELGMAEAKKYTVRPYEHIKAVRLTALGRYALGLENTYQPPKTKREPLFELDEKRLIIRSLQPGNTYESLLHDTAHPIGNARYKLSPESFLASCKSSADVERKVTFFKQYVSAQLPPVWEDFFKSIMRRCNPLAQDKTAYEIFTISADNEELMRLLVSDATLRSLVVRAEGYRILVSAKNKTAFVNRLKTFGYLV